jgi:hypothetical protein
VLPQRQNFYKIKQDAIPTLFLNGNEPSNKFLVKILSHHKKTPPQTSDDRIFSSPSPSDLLTKHEPCEAPEVVPKLEFSSPKNHKKTPPQTSDNRASPSPSPFDLTKHEPCEAPKVVPILEFSSPWRFTADPPENSMINVCIPNMHASFPNVSDHLCNDKILLLDEIVNLKIQLKRANEKYLRLHDIYESTLKEKQRLQTDVEKQTKAQSCVTKLEADAENSNSLAIFILDQVYNYAQKRPKWTESTIRQCIAWRYASPKGYEFGRRSHIIKAPSKTTLRRYMSGIKGTHDLIQSRLLAEANNLKDIERVCSLVVDDMAIKEKLEYNRSEDKFYGLPSIPTNNPMGKRPVLANKLLCFVIHGLSTKYTIPVGYFFHKTLSSERFHQITLDILKLVHRLGFKVLRLVSDNHKSNVALFKSLGSGELKTRIQHPVEPQMPLFLSFDYCHVIKNARNIFLDHKMASSKGIIQAEYLQQLHTIQKSCLIKPIPFLTKKHLFPNTFEKMNVLRAVQIFSPAIIAALKYLAAYNNSSFDFSEAHATIEYIENMNQFFKVHDVSDRVQHFKQLDPQCAPYTDMTDERLTWLSETFPKYIEDIQNTSAKKKMKGLTKETAHALIFTSHSTSACIKYLLTETNFYFVLTRAFNSDAIESMFSNIRMRGGSHDATDANAAHYAIQNILKSGIIKSAPSANVSVDITSISTVIIPPTPTMTVVIPEEDLQFDLPDSINDSIAELRCESYHVGFGIISASVAMMAGYIIKTLEERIDCSCSEQFTTTSSCTPLLGLIHLRDRGALKYPKRSFVALVHSISNIVNEILPCLPPEGNPFKNCTFTINR